MARWIVGTAVNQVGRVASNHAKKASAWNFGGHTVEPPADSGQIRPFRSPWLWKSGITLRQRSEGFRSSQLRIAFDDAMTMDWRTGTTLGRPVVPAVGSRYAMLSGAGCESGRG